MGRFGVPAIHCRAMLLVLSFALSTAYAGTPELVVVGVHVPGLLGTAPMDAATRLTDALDGTGKVDAVDPIAVSKRISGRESLILEAFALGPGRERLKEAHILYDRAQVDQAVPALDDAVSLLGQGLAYTADARDLGEALVLLGMADVGMGDEAAAKGAFRKAATLDVRRELDPVNFPPRVIEMYDAVRASVAKQSPATLTVTASMDATVYVDGRTIGPMPTGDVPLVPGEHYLLVRAKSGASKFETLTVTPGQRVTRDVLLEQRGIGVAAMDLSGRGRQVRELYKALGEHVNNAPVVLAGATTPGQVAVQLYSPASGNFSRALTGEAGDDPVSAICDLAPALVGYLNESGDIRADRVSPQVIPLDISQNDVLAALLYDPPKAPVAVATTAPAKGPPWWLWAGVGAVVVAGGGVTAAVLVASAADGGNSGDTGGNDDPDQGSVEFGPIP